MLERSHASSLRKSTRLLIVYLIVRDVRLGFVRSSDKRSLAIVPACARHAAAKCPDVARFSSKGIDLDARKDREEHN